MLWWGAPGRLPLDLLLSYHSCFPPWFRIYRIHWPTQELTEASFWRWLSLLEHSRQSLDCLGIFFLERLFCLASSTCFYVQQVRTSFEGIESRRLGFLVGFLSHAAIVGFMAGAAIIIGLQQLKGLLGISHFTTKTDAVSVLESAFRSIHHQVCPVSVFSLVSLRNSLKKDLWTRVDPIIAGSVL